MRRRVVLGLVVLGLLLPGARAFAAEPTSGLSVGTPTPSIPVFDVTGPYKGERICYVCDFQTAPSLLGFFRGTSDETAELIVRMNELYLANKARNFKAVAMIVAGPESKAWLENLGRSANIEIPLTYFTKGPKDVAGRVYKLNPEVENTFVLAVDRFVVANVSGIKTGEFDQVTNATARMLAGGGTRKP